MKILAVISGGQTGADQGALEAALEKSVLCGGWCPRGRRAERGKIPRRFPVIELEDEEYPLRTLANIRSSHATLVFTRGDGRTVGTAKTIRMAYAENKHCLVVNLDQGADAAYVRIYRWMDQLKVEATLGDLVLNVAGPRESKRSGIQAQVFKVMCEVLDVYGVKVPRRVAPKLRTRG